MQLTFQLRPDQLIVQDDPAFIPDFFLPGLDLDLSALDMSTNQSSLRSSLLSPHSKRFSVSIDKGDAGSMLGLIIPTSDTGGGGDLGGFIMPEDRRSSVQRSIGLGGLLEGEEEGFNLNPGFTVDADGNLLVMESLEDPQRQTGRAIIGGPDTGEDAITSENIQLAISRQLRNTNIEASAQGII